MTTGGRSATATVSSPAPRRRCGRAAAGRARRAARSGRSAAARRGRWCASASSAASLTGCSAATARTAQSPTTICSGRDGRRPGPGRPRGRAQMVRRPARSGRAAAPPRTRWPRRTRCTSARPGACAPPGAARPGRTAARTARPRRPGRRTSTKPTGVFIQALAVVTNRADAMPATATGTPGPPVRPRREPVPAVQVEAEEDRLEEERERLQGERRPEDAAVAGHERRPQQAELERQHGAADRADREEHGEGLGSTAGPAGTRPRRRCAASATRRTAAATACPCRRRRRRCGSSARAPSGRGRR